MLLKAFLKSRSRHQCESAWMSGSEKVEEMVWRIASQPTLTPMPIWREKLGEEFSINSLGETFGSQAAENFTHSHHIDEGPLQVESDQCRGG